ASPDRISSTAPAPKSARPGGRGKLAKWATVRRSERPCTANSPPPDTSPSQPLGSPIERPPPCNLIYITLPTPAAKATTMNPTAAFLASGAPTAAIGWRPVVGGGARPSRLAGRGNPVRPKRPAAPMAAPAFTAPEGRARIHVGRVLPVTTNVEMP